MSGSVQGFPPLSSPMVDPRTGQLTQPWYRLLISLWQRTGGSTGPGGETVDFSNFDLLSPDDAVPSEDPFLLFESEDKPSNEGCTILDDIEVGQISSSLDYLLAEADCASSQDRLQSWMTDEPMDVGEIFNPLFLMPTDETSRDDVTNLVSITVGASPFTHQASRRSIVLIVGGTMSAVQFSRDGSTFYGIGNATRFVVLGTGDSLRVTYSVAPAMYEGSI